MHNQSTINEPDVSHGKRSIPVLSLCCPLGECLIVTGNHVVSVNPVRDETTWRTDCDTCGTCLSDRHLNRSAAIAYAMAHATKEVVR